jgi:LPXTG-site transpeptidase (sortase) family protein
MTRQPYLRRNLPRVIALILCALLLPVIAAQQADTLIIASPARQIITDPLDAVAFSPDGLMIASGDRDNLIRLWDTQTGETRAFLTGHTDWVTELAFSPDGSVLASGSHDDTVRLWNTRTLEPIHALTHHTQSVTGVAYSSDGLLLATASLDGTIWVGDATTGDELATLPSYGGPVWGIAFSPDGHSLVTGSEDGTIWLYGLYDSSVSLLAGHTGPVTALTFNPNGSTLATSSWDRTVRLWNIEEQTEIEVFEGHQSPVTGVAFANEGTEIISSGLDGMLYIWDIKSGDVLAELQGNGSPLGGLAFDSVNRQLVAAGIDGVLDLWDIGGRVQDLIVEAQPTPAPIVVAQAPPPVVRQEQPPAEESALIENPAPVENVNPPPIEQPTTPTQGTYISLPTVNIHSATTFFPLDGVSWAINPWERAVGHFQGTAWIDTPGNIVLGGHSLMPDGTPGIFNGLYGLNIGDPVILTVDGQERRYHVTSSRTVNYDDLSVVYPTPTDRVTLITCDIPSFDPNANYYWERLVIVAEPG